MSRNSTMYIVRNKTSEWKTIHHLMTEACTGNWEWIEGREGFLSKAERNKKARESKIAPHSELTINIVSGDGTGFWSDSFSTGRTRSFVIESIENIEDPSKPEPLSSKRHRTF